MTRYFTLRYLTAYLLVGLLAFPALAQPQRAGRAHLAQRLDLSETQRTEMQDLRQEQTEALRSWRDTNPDATRDDVRAFRDQQRAAFDEAFARILTPEQADQLASIREQANERRDERRTQRQADRGEERLRRGQRQGAPGAGRSARGLFRDLDLSETQRDALRDLRETQREAAQTWRTANTDATAEQRRAFFDAQRSAYQGGLASILTTEQQERLKEQASQRVQRRNRGRRDAAQRHLRRLDLSDVQQDALRTLRDEQRAARDAWRSANPEATPDQRTAFAEEQREALRSGLEQILTAEQQEQLETLKAQRGERVRGERGRRNQRGQRAARQRTDQQDDTRAAAQQPDYQLDNYPNPFNPTTEIRFTLPAEAEVTLDVYDLQGRRVAQVLQGRLSAGPHQASFDASNLPSGVYLYRLSIDGRSQTKRMTLTK